MISRKARALALAVAALAVAAAPAAASETKIGEGHITIGGPYTQLITAGEAGVDGVDSFFLSAPPEGTTIFTRTVDNSGLDYDLDFYFWAPDGSYVGSCAEAGTEERCPVPAGVAEVEVAAWLGHDLDVEVFQIDPVVAP